ncbi:CHAT domain-containing protein [Streptomyces sp. NPDC003077]|uniref:CHAT domain-containing protein n=1 Tax=Streptomyces sp. NPDC003077 TaxID=3154443 RepID=UPI0033A5A51E
MLSPAGPAGSWRVVRAADAVEAAPVHVRWPEDGEPRLLPAPESVRRRWRERLRQVRLEGEPGGGLSVGGIGSADAPPWRGTWTGGNGDEADGTGGVRYGIGAVGFPHASLDGWLLADGDRARLDALCLLPGSGGTWAAAVRTRIALTRTAPARAVPGRSAPARAAPPAEDSAEGGGTRRRAEPWGRSFRGTVVPVDEMGNELPGHGLDITFGHPPRLCRETTSPAMALCSTAPLVEAAVQWIAHCADSADIRAEQVPDAATHHLTVEYGPRHEDIGAPIWNVRRDLPSLPGFALPVKADHGRARLVLRGTELTGVVELTGRIPVTGEPVTYRARFAAEENTTPPPSPDPVREATTPPDAPPTEPLGAPSGVPQIEPSGVPEPDLPLPASRDLLERWWSPTGPLRWADLTERDAAAWAVRTPHRAASYDGGLVLRFFEPWQLAVGLLREPGADADRPPELVVLRRAEPTRGVSEMVPAGAGPVHGGRQTVSAGSESAQGVPGAGPAGAGPTRGEQQTASTGSEPTHRDSQTVSTSSDQAHEAPWVVTTGAEPPHRNPQTSSTGLELPHGPPQTVSTSPKPEAAPHDRFALRDVAQRLVVAGRHAEARPLLRHASAAYERAAAQAEETWRDTGSARWRETLIGEWTSLLFLLDHQTICDAALGDHEALVDRLARSGEIRARLLEAGRDPGRVPYRPELVADTLKAALGQTQYAEYWRTMLDHDEERVDQLQAVEPFHSRLVRALTRLGEPGAALLAAEAGRGRAFADLIGRAVPRPLRARRAWVFGAPPPPNEERLRLLLSRSGQPAVVYHLSGDLLVRWVALPGGDTVAHAQRLDVPELAAAVRRVRVGGPTATATQLTRQADSVGHPGGTEDALRHLGQLLWPAEVDDLLPDDPDHAVTLVPHGPLAHVPFAALPDDAGRPLVRRHALTVLPALSLLEGLLDRRDTRREERPAPARLLAFVAPEPLPDGLLPLDVAAEWFPALVDAYGPARSTAHYGRNATAEHLAREAAAAGILCFVSHASTYDGSAGTDPMDSYVALAATAAHDGRLRAAELGGLRTGADLVVLAACESGLGRSTADGVIGLGRAFLVRGPTAVLMTLAPVRETDALTVVLGFFEGWLREGRTRAAALRRAQLELADTCPGDPARWSPYILLGLGGRGLVPPAPAH